MKNTVRNSIILGLLVASVTLFASAQTASAPGFRPAIRIPFARLQSRPENYENKTITAVAFLAIDRGVLKIFPSRDAFVFDDQSSAVSLRGDFKYLQASSKFSRSYVLITGKFRRIDHEGSEFALGELSDFRVILRMDEDARLHAKENKMLLRSD